jgi:hypothetical protein
MDADGKEIFQAHAPSRGEMYRLFQLVPPFVVRKTTACELSAKSPVLPTAKPISGVKK